MSETTRLATEQGRLVAALVAGDELLAGFDPRGARALSAVLVAKRRKAVSHAVPRIPRTVGGEFVARFAQFARVTPLGTNGDATDDAIAFLGWLRRRKLLPSGLRFLSGRLRWRSFFRRVLPLRARHRTTAR